MKQSKFFSLSKSDLIDGAIMAALTVIVLGAITILKGIIAVPPTYPDIDTFIKLLITGLTTAGIFILQKLISNSEGKFLKREKKCISTNQ